ncbi:ABC transporter permease [Treponema sp. OMZ 840]|uniref:ABC transporter permease subunit n=1 Tax=Treponema sp. OMZ 840 TaxID=244313 RepID=UPI003D8C6F6C
MNALQYIFVSAAPLMLISIGVLVSEYAGVTAVFADGIINLTAFLFFAFAVFTENLVLSAALSLASAVLIMHALSLFVHKTHSNPFLAGLSVNLFAAGFSSLLSYMWFGTRGIAAEYVTGTGVFSDVSVSFSRLPAAVFAWIVSAALAFILYKTVWGMRIRITGESPEVLASRGIGVNAYKSSAWRISALCAGVSGIIYCLKLSAFVPNISAGKGWLALAAVFLGRKTVRGTFLAVIVFAAAEYAANRLQVFSKTFPPSVLISLPYIAAILLFALLPAGKKK